MLNKEPIAEKLSGEFGLDDLVLTCIAIHYDLNVRLNDRHLVWLSMNNLLQRDGPKIVLSFNLLGEDLTVPEPVIDDINRYRYLFKPVRPGAIASKKTVTEDMRAWMKANPDITFDQIVEATKQYLERADLQFVPNADNFISKLDKSGRSVSMLSIAIESQIEDEVWL